MDCEKFDRIVLDLLYAELDELTDASARRHIEHCARCKAVVSGLRATREVGVLPLVDPPEGLELGILEAERRANAKLPLRKKLGRGISILAVYAMRPQLAMAALLLLVIGSSLFFLRAQPGDGESLVVTERGTPEAEAAEHVAILPAPERRSAAEATPTPKAAAKGEAVAQRERADDKPSGEPAAPPAEVAANEAAPGKATDGEAAAAPEADSIEAANAAFQGGRYVEAQRRFEEIAARGGSDAAVAALQAVEALRRQRGCPAAAPRYEDVHSRFRDTPSGSEAAWQAGDCYRALGELSRARQSLEALLEVAEYRSRAETALNDLKAREEQVAEARKAKSAPPAGAAAPASPPAAAPAPAKAAKPAQPKVDAAH